MGLRWSGSGFRLTVRLILAVAAMAACLGLVVYYHVPLPARHLFPFPADKQCAISITDDTDGFRLATTRPVYDLLDSLGLRITRTTWIYDAPGHPPAQAGLSLANIAYRNWLLGEITRGHEITLHSPSAGDDTRERILAAHDTLRHLVGHPASLEIFHSDNKEALYWGADRLPNPILRAVYRRIRHARFEGAKPGSPYYWSDISRSLVRYVRGYTFNEVNTLRLNPDMPYMDSRTPGAPLWFANSNGRTPRAMLRLLSPENVAKLKKQRGACIIYTHLADGFSDQLPGGGGVVAPQIRALFRRVGTDPGVEFVPAGELLDRLRVIQLLEDAQQSNRRAVSIPSELMHAIDGISAAGDLAKPGTPGEGGKGRTPGRESLRAWLEAHQIRCEVGGDVFAEPREIGSEERWRLTLRWVITQFVSPT